MASTVLKAAGFLSIFSASSAAGVIYSQRQANVVKARAELDTEFTALTGDLNALRAEYDSTLAWAAAEAKVITERQEVLHTIWSDRAERCDAALERARGCLSVLPETAETLEDLKDHYAHMAKQMPMFINFDGIASRIHAIGLITSSASTARGIDNASNGSNANSIRRNMDVAQSLLHDDPVAAQVFKSIDRTTAPEQIPASYEELSMVFGRARRYLTEAAEAYDQRLAAAQKRLADEQLRASGEYKPYRPGSLSGGLRSTVAWLKMEDDMVKPVPPAVLEEQQRQQEISSYVLRNREDVFKALLHHHKLKREIEANKGKKFLADPHVVRAVASLDIWAQSAEAFLVDEQSHRILKAIHTAVQHSLVVVDEAFEERKR